MTSAGANAMRKLYIHCGLAKTGTTSLQVYLSRHKADLNDLSFDYPAIGLNLPADAHHNLALGIQRHARFKPSSGSVDDLLDYLRGPERAPNVVISSEAFAVCLANGDAQERFFDFLRKAGKANDEVFVLFTFRAFWRSVESKYLAQLNRGMPDRTLEFQVERSKRWYANFFAQLAALRDVVGANGVIGLDVEHAFPDSISAMLAAVGIEKGCLPQWQWSQNSNARLSLKKAAFLYQFQFAADGVHKGRSKKDVAALARALKQLPSFSNDEPEYHVVSFERANEIQDFCRAQLPPFLSVCLKKLTERESVPFHAAILADVKLSGDEVQSIHDVMRAAYPFICS
jgi:hypothetical protein